MDNIIKMIIDGVLSEKIDEQVAVELIQNLKTMDQAADDDIAIVGIGLKMPMAGDVDAFWNVVLNKVDCMTRLPKSRQSDLDNYIDSYSAFEKKYKIAAYLEDIDKFDCQFFGIPPKEAGLMDPNQRLFLETAYSAIEDAGYGGDLLAGCKTGVYVGFSGTTEYLQYITHVDASQLPQSFVGNISQIIASRVSYLLDLKGPSMLINTACASSLSAVHIACQGIRNGDCEMAIAGGIKIDLLPLENVNTLGMDSPDKKTKSFSDDSNGTGWGEGGAAILLRPLRNALKSRDHIYAVIKGSAINQDGNSNGITAPDPIAQKNVIVSAWENANIDPQTISFIEAQGIGIKLSDAVEVEGIRMAMEEYTCKKQFCAIGSLKSNFGHLDHAAGIASLVKASLALKNNMIPPTVHFNTPNKNINFINSSVYVSDNAIPWTSDGTPMRCGVSSFGLGGTNCHVVLEEFIEKPRPVINRDHSFVFTVSARNTESLYSLLWAYKSCLSGRVPRIEDLCFTVNIGRGHYEYRVAILVKSMETLMQGLDALLAQGLGMVKEGYVYYGEHCVIPAGSDRIHPCDITENQKLFLSQTADDKMELYLQSEKNRADVLAEICQLYVQGADIKWKRLYIDIQPHRVALPTYPFLKQRCWLDVPGADQKGRGIVPDTVMPMGRREGRYTATERKMTNIWGNVLAVERLNIFATLYDIGGDSITAMQILHDYNRLYSGRKIDLAELLKNPSIFEISKQIDAKTEFADIPEVKSKIQAGEQFPLTPSQKRIYIQSLYSNVGLSYNMPFLFTVKGEIDLLKWERAVKRLVKRHEALRTSFFSVNGEIFQKISEDTQAKIHYLKCVKDDVDRQLEEFIKPFDLSCSPLFRIGLMEIAENEYIFTFDIHHIICDAVSMNILIHDFIKLYDGKTLPKPKMQYRDAVYEQNLYLQSDAFKRQERYWHQVFSTIPQQLNIPLDFPRGSLRDFEAGVLTFQLDEMLSYTIERVSSQASATVFMFFLSVLNILLYKCSSQEDIVIGSPIAGRRISEFNQIVGVFINTLAIRTQVDTKQSFLEFFNSVKNNSLAAYENQDVPFDHLVNSLKIDMKPNRNPLFDVLLIMQNIKVQELNIDGLKLTGYQTENTILGSKVDMQIEVMRKNNGFEFVIIYGKKIFSDETINGFAERYKMIISEIVNNPEIFIKDIEIPTMQKQAMIDDFNKAL